MASHASTYDGLTREVNDRRISRRHTASRTGRIEVTVEGVRTTTFILQGRSTAERKFKQEAEVLRHATTDDSLTVEWIFLPFYNIYGHSVVRIGNQLYEFGKHGWKLHTSARAFLFNNPFFKRRVARYRDSGNAAVLVWDPLFSGCSQKHC